MSVEIYPHICGQPFRDAIERGRLGDAGEGLLHSRVHRLFQVAACKGLELPEGKEIFASLLFLVE